MGVEIRGCVREDGNSSSTYLRNISTGNSVSVESLISVPFFAVHLVLDEPKRGTHKIVSVQNCIVRFKNFDQLTSIEQTI